jgi:hypothetical protein
LVKDVGWTLIAVSGAPRLLGAIEELKRRAIFVALLLKLIDTTYPVSEKQSPGSVHYPALL